MIITNDRSNVVTEGRLTDDGGFSEDGGLRVELNMPTGTLEPDTPYTFRVALSPGSDFPWSRGGTASPTRILGKGASGLTMIVDGEKVDFGDVGLAIDGRTIAEGNVDRLMSLVLVAEIATLQVPMIVEGLIVHFVYEASSNYLRRPEHRLTTGHQFDNRVLASDEASLLTTCFGDTRTADAMQDAERIEFEIEVAFGEGGQHTVTFFPDIRFETLALTGDNMTGSTTAWITREYRRQISIQVQVRGTEDTSSDASATMLVLDRSGSMDDPDQSGVAKIEAARTASANLLTIIEQDNALQPLNHLVGLVAFDDQAYLLAGPSDDLASVRGALSQLSAGGETNIGAGLHTALTAMETADPSLPRYIILMTDGQPTEGPTTLDEFLRGPLATTRDAGVCVYTVGFGMPDDLDEDLLRGIAHESGCGEYYQANVEYSLGVSYTRARHQMTGSNVQTFSDVVRQGATVELGRYRVETAECRADFTLQWPGSEVDLLLTDPRGREVTDGYPGATFLAGEAMQRILVDGPLPGDWRVAAYGRDVPEGVIDVDATISTQPQAETPAEGPAGGGLGPVVIILVAAVAGLVIYAFARTRRMQLAAEGVGPVSPGPSPGATLVVLSGPRAGQQIPVTAGSFSIGRSHESGLHLSARQVSRQHAVLRYAQGRWFLQDRGSAGGTFVNGRRVGATALSDGDVIRIGDTELQFRAA